jgi:hypothetical protein
MIWSRHTACGFGPLQVASGHPGQYQYLQILRECLPDAIKKHGMDMDNDSKHRINNVQQ